MKFKLSAVAFLVCLLLLVPNPAFAQPPLPHYFYGSLSVGGQAAPLGTVVEARGANVITGITGNPISITVAGQYGSVSEPRLYVQGPNIENGDIIELYVNGAKASETYQFQSGAITKLNLTIASAPPPLPASFVVADLTVSPAQVEPGETVTIEAEVTNSGGSTGDYTATLKINGTIVDSVSLTLDPGEDQIVSFTIAKETTGTYTVQLAGLEGTFIVTEPTEPVPPEAPASFECSSLSISPVEVNVGETVSISVLVANTGEEEGSYATTLKINGVVEANKDITLDAGASEKVTFILAKDIAGSYSVEINGLSGSFIVREEQEPVSPVTPPAPPSPEPELTPTPSGVNWAILGPVIGVAVFLAIFLPIRLRKRRAG